MSNSKMVYSAFLFLSFLVSFVSSSYFNTSLTTTHKCSAQQTVDLLLFKQNISSIDNIYSSYYRYACPDSGYDPITMNWNKDIDCCNWDGVTCDHSTGDIIGLDLSCGMLQGIIHPNTTLFNLPHLQRLNIAYNAFAASQFPREIARFSSSLTHLNISGCRFTGQIPLEISFLSKLVSIDLSENLGLQIQPYAFNNLLQNCTRLRELLIGRVDISWVLPTYLNISSSLESLDLSFTGLQGKLPYNIFNFQYLEKLVLSHNNDLTGSLPNVIVNQSSLKVLDLSFTGLQGNLPDNIFNLRRLEKLDLSYDYDLTGQLPIMTSTEDNPLNWLDLSHTGLSGEIFNSTGHLKSLTYLDLSNCFLVGPLPKSLANLTHLITLNLMSNMLSGTLPSWLFTFPSLENIHLDYNMFTGGLPSNWFYFRSLKKLTLRDNQFDGHINQDSTTPPSFIQLINLFVLDLSYNKFIGLWDLDTLLLSIPNLIYLDLSYSGLSVMSNNANNWYANPAFYRLGLASCNLTVFPKSLRAMKILQILDLSNNEIHGHIPDWAGEIGGNALVSLDLSHNSITSLPQFQWDGLVSLYLQSNMIQGPFPLSICNISRLTYLDMSNNSFGGSIPQCLRDIRELWIIDLRNNHFYGTIPSFCENYGKLDGLILNGNQLQGELPTSLSNCQSLKILDVGNNHLNGTLPGWLGGLPKLQVLILKSNNFHGPIEIPSAVKLPFPSLVVFDLSHNRFEGLLPAIYFQNFNSMKDVLKNGTNPEYLSLYGHFYTIIVTVKGHDLPFPKILVDYTIVDLSHNKFEGDIPNVIGSLKSLIALNLSHNNLNGRIPHTLGNLSEIESLDLSWNQLIGEIPQSLAGITTLAVLNLSQNHLVGRIPEGTQFRTFEGNSFGGNSGLCGLPLPNMCSPHPREPHVEVNTDEEESGFTWRVVMVGYGCGTLFGLLAGFLMLSSGRPKWFTEISDAAEHMILKRRNKRRYIYIGR